MNKFQFLSVALAVSVVLACASASNATIVTATMTVNVPGSAGTAGNVADGDLQDGLSTGTLDPGSYVTPDNGDDYLLLGPSVVFSYDFGSAVTVTDFNAGLYLGGHRNTATQYTIDLGTTAGGDEIASDLIVNFDFLASSGVTQISLGATYTGVLFATATITDNGFMTGMGQGDRVGTSEASFVNVIPEPSSFALVALGMVGSLVGRS